MCGFGIGTIFQVAIFVIVVLVVIALLRAVFPGLWTGRSWHALLGYYSDCDRRRHRDPHPVVHLEARRMLRAAGSLWRVVPTVRVATELTRRQRLEARVRRLQLLLRDAELDLWQYVMIEQTREYGRALAAPYMPKKAA